MKMIKENISNVEDIFEMLDSLIKEQSRFNWDSFYGDREKDVPFFINAPDENLIEYFEKKGLNRRKCLN